MSNEPIKPAGDAVNKAPMLKSKLGLKLEVLGRGLPVNKTETLRVKRLNDEGIRDIPLPELEKANGKKPVAAAVEWAESQPSPEPPAAPEPTVSPSEMAS